MRWPRRRFRLSTALIAVAVLGIIFGLQRIRFLAKEYGFLSRKHWNALLAYDDVYAPPDGLSPELVRIRAHQEVMRQYHGSLSEKYCIAASHPWLPVPPDPPPPK
jgi:hypothetical protein